ncbi:hypothetical protein JOD54_003961 [Actinokineospora baliensis]|uniref:hypothetical protein n=1 Tax=Actinokineospora baliensis TaxID=547056 RepID=UPI00195E1407|nr:hypothetical protein [Actinokineospora baliensis]MBM7773757.1 hypothetical protein [Actinokineospora baliensis]
MRALIVAGATAVCSVLLAGQALADGTTPADITWVTANSDSTGDQDNSAIATVRTGYTAVVWEDDRDTTNPTDPVHSEVYLRLYRDGVSQYEKKLSAGGTGNWRHVQPDVSLHEDGSAVVVWSEDPDANGYYNIAVRAVNTAGTVTGSTTANASADGQQLNPSVAADPDGPGFAVAFEDKQGTAAPTVRLSGFASITSKTYEVQVNNTGGTHQRPDVAMGAPGNAVVAWDEDGDANGSFNIGRKIVTPTGAVKLAQGVANVTTAGQQRHPSIAANFNGDFVIAWESDTQVGVRSFTATGVARAAADTLVPGADPQAGIDDQLNVVVGWSEAADIWAQGLNPNGSTTGRLPRLRVHTVVAGSQTEPAVAVSAFGQVVLAYTDDNDGNGFDQVRLGTGLINSTW